MLLIHIPEVCRKMSHQHFIIITTYLFIGLSIPQRPANLGLDLTPTKKQPPVETKTDYGKYR